MRKKLRWMPLILLLAMLPICVAAQESAAANPDEVPAVQSKAAVVMDAATGRVLFAQQAHERLPVASTTKIMTALLTLEQDGLDTYFTVDSAAIQVEGSSMGLRAGDSVSLRALAAGMLLASGNDGANAAAVRIAGSQRAFAARMNQRAAELGMKDTHFVTPSGLHDPLHYSSAYDMALLAREALQNPAFAALCGQSKLVVQYGNPPYDRWLSNHNRLLREYQGAIGVKTGFTKAAGRCLVSCAQREGVRLIIVTLGCPDDWNTHRRLFDWYFARLQLQTPELPALALPVVGGQQRKVTLEAQALPQVALLAGETVTFNWELPQFIYAPVKREQVVGWLAIRVDGQSIEEVALTACEAVDAVEKQGFFSRLFRLA